MRLARPSKYRLPELMWIAAVVVGGDATADLDSDSGIWGVVGASGSAAALSPKLEGFRWWIDTQVRFRDSRPQAVASLTVVSPADQWLSSFFDSFGAAPFRS
jgi:hypothetical protein